MIVYVLFVHKKSVSKRKVCIIFKIKNKKNKKTILVGFLGVFFCFFWVGFFGRVFYCQPCNKAHTSEISLVGRLVFNTWRMMRGELALYSYTLESVAFKVVFFCGGGEGCAFIYVFWVNLKKKLTIVRYPTGLSSTRGA
jgi:hypothetical protein